MQWYWRQYLGGATGFRSALSGGPGPRGVSCGPAARGDRHRRSGSPAQRGVRLRAPVAQRRGAGRAPGLSRFVPRLHDDPSPSRAGGFGAATWSARDLRQLLQPASREPDRHDRGSRRHRHRRGVRRALRACTALRLAGPFGDRPRGGPRCGRHLVLEPLSRRALRCRKCGLFLLIRRSAAASWTWSERFAAQPEILAYLRHVADRFDLRRHYRFGVDVVGAAFDQDASLAGPHRRPVHVCRAVPVVRDRLPVGGEPAGHPRHRRFRGRRLLHRRVAARGPRPERQARRPDRHRFVRDPGGCRSSPRRPTSSSCSSDPRTTPFRCPTAPGRTRNGGRSRRSIPERRRQSAYAAAGTPHGTLPTRRPSTPNRRSALSAVAALA